jgi:hypothetical protein
MDKKETLVMCDHANAIKCRMTCHHKKPHCKEPTDDEEDCAYEGYCTNVNGQVQCEEIKI